MMKHTENRIICGREDDRRIKEKFERLLKGEVIYTPIDEQIVYNQLDGNEKMDSDDKI